jgi:two-component sensor histidine kinase
VHLHWTCGPDRIVHIQWRESGGPPVTAPARRGFGSDLIEGLISYELGGRSTLHFDAAGLRCDMMFPMFPAGSDAPIASDVSSTSKFNASGGLR